MDQNEKLIGAWRLEQFVTLFEDGSRLEPYGPNAQGRIIYSADGMMAAHLWNPDRHLDEAEPSGDPAYFSYCGTWSISDGIVCHDVHAATLPSWTGQKRLRSMAWRGKALELVAENVVFENKTGRGVLLWTPMR